METVYVVWLEGKVTGSFPASLGRNDAKLRHQDAILRGSSAIRRPLGLFTAAPTTMGRRSIVSSRYLSPATACAVELSGTKPSAPIIKASLGANLAGLRKNPLVRRLRAWDCAAAFSIRNRRTSPSCAASKALANRRIAAN